MANDPKGPFRTYLRYLEAFHTIAATQYSGENLSLMATPPMILAGIKAHIRATNRYQRVAARTAIDFDLLSRALKSAWGTELLLCITPTLSDDDEFKALSNNWGAVQAYYSCYHIAQALTIAQGNKPPDTHAKLQNVFTSFWTTSTLSLPPWSLGWKNAQCSGLPAGVTTWQVKSWSTVTDDSCWSFAAMVLRTTREELLTERNLEERKRLQRERQKQFEAKQEARTLAGKKLLKHRIEPAPLLSEAQKDAIDSGLRHTTLLDVLYRLRKRSNYEDPTMFIEGPDDVSETKHVHRNLRSIVATTSFAHELFIRQFAGPAWFDDEVAAWIRGTGSISTAGLAGRQALLA